MVAFLMILNLGHLTSKYHMFWLTSFVLIHFYNMMHAVVYFLRPRIDNIISQKRIDNIIKYVQVKHS